MRPVNQQTNQKQEQGYQRNQSATLKVLGIASEVFYGEIRNISKKGGTQVLVGQPLRCASLVMIDYDDNRLLGEVVYCDKRKPGGLSAFALNTLCWVTTAGSSESRVPRRTLLTYPMKVVVRSSSLLFFLISILLELPVHRRNRDVGNGDMGVTPSQVLQTNVLE